MSSSTQQQQQQSSFIFITSFYSGRTYRIDVGAALIAKRGNNFTLTYGTILGLLRSHWKSLNYQKTSSSKNVVVASSAGNENKNDNNNTEDNNNNASASASASSATKQQQQPAAQTNQTPPPTMDLLLFDSSPSSSSNSSQFVPANDEIPRQLIYSGSPNQNLQQQQASTTSNNNNNSPGAGNNTTTTNNFNSRPYLLFLLYKPAHRDNMERLLMERTTPHPQDLSPSPSNQVEKATTALLSIFTHLSSKARQEVEGLLTKTDRAKVIMEEYEKTLESDVKKVLALRDGEVASEISVTSADCLSGFVADVHANLSKAMSVVSDFQFPTNINTLLLNQTASGTKISPDKCYDAAANARKELNDMTLRLAKANELITAVFEQYFPRFESLRSLPEAYPVAEEIARRRVDLYQACTRIQNQLSGEAIAIQEQIAGFVQQYGSKFPQNVLRGLDAPVPAIHVAYEPLLRSVPVSIDGGTGLLKKFGLMSSNNNNTNSNPSNSSPNTTQPPSPNTATTNTLPNTANPSPAASFPSVKDNNNNNKTPSSTLTTASSSMTSSMLSPSNSNANKSGGESNNNNDQIEKIIELFKLSENESEARRRLENQAADERLDVTALRSNEEKMVSGSSTTVAAMSSSSSLDKNNNNNLVSLGNFFRRNNDEEQQNKQKADAKTINNNNNNDDAASSSEVSRKEYSLAVTFDISRMLSLWNLGDAEYKDQIRNELTILLSPAVLNFQRPVASRPAFAIALGGMFRVSWARGDAAPTHNPKSSLQENGKTKGRVVAVEDMKVLEDANKNNGDLDLTTTLMGQMPLLELVCQVKRV